jgi:hypothetical protein
MNRGCFALCLSWDTVHLGKSRVHRNQVSTLNLTILGHARLPLSHRFGGLLRRARRGSVLASSVNHGQSGLRRLVLTAR